MDFHPVAYLAQTTPLTEMRNLIEIAVGVVVLIGAAKSAYNGIIRDIYANLQSIPEINRRLVGIESQQEEIVDALVALSHVQRYDDVEIDPQEIRRSFDRVDQSKGFLDRDDASEWRRESDGGRPDVESDSGGDGDRTDEQRG